MNLGGRSPYLPVLAVLVLVVGLFISSVLSELNFTNAFAFGLGVVVFFISFAKTQLAIYFLIFAMLLSPEIDFGSLSESGVEGGRAVAIRLDDLFLMLIVFGWFAKAAINKDVGLVTKSPLNGRIYIYSAVFTLSTFAGMLYGDVDGVLGFFNVVKYLEYYILYFMILNNLETEKQARNFIKAALITNFIIAVYALSQIPSGERISAPFEGEGGEPNTLGGYLVIMISITLGLFLETDHFFKRLGYGALSALNLLALMYTESRSSYLGLLLAAIVLMTYAKRRNLLILGLVVAAVFSTIILPENVKERIKYTFAERERAVELFQDKGLGVDASTQARIDLYNAAFEGWKKYPLLGWGVTGFRFLDAQYMKVLVESGVIGLVAFFLLLAVIFREGKKVVNFTKGKSPFYRGIALGYTAGFLGLCAHAIGTNTFIIIRIMEPFWLFTGIVISIPRLLSQAESKSAEPEEDRESESRYKI